VRSFDYYRRKSGGSKVDSVYCSEEGHHWQYYSSFVRKLGVEVKLGEPLGSINAEKGAVHEAEKNSHRLELAIAAALAGSKGINLLPIEIQRRDKKVINAVPPKQLITTAVTV